MTHNEMFGADHHFEIGKGEIRRQGKKLAILSKKIAFLAFGSMVKPALDAAEVITEV